MQDSPIIDEKNVYTREWSVDPDVLMSEDCLYLNVWAPAADGTKNLPVFVWYFGGGLQVGHPSEMEFDGERIARRGIVVVTINYRVNAFGFLCHPEITAESPDAPANFGHLDQQAATRWVKRNIAAFGGDPDNITIGGQSAGGGSVMNQLTSPQNQGLFQRAIVESGLAATVYPNKQHFGYIPELAEAEQSGEKFFRFLGVRTLAEARAIDEVTLRDKVHGLSTVENFLRRAGRTASAGERGVGLSRRAAGGRSGRSAAAARRAVGRHLSDQHTRREPRPGERRVYAVRAAYGTRAGNHPRQAAHTRCGAPGNISCRERTAQSAQGTQRSPIRGALPGPLPALSTLLTPHISHSVRLRVALLSIAVRFTHLFSTRSPTDGSIEYSVV